MLSLLLPLSPVTLTAASNTSVALAVRRGIAAASGTALELALIAAAWDSSAGRLAVFAVGDAVNQVGNRPDVSSLLQKVFGEQGQLKQRRAQGAGTPTAAAAADAGDRLGLASGGLAQGALLASGITTAPNASSATPTITLCLNVISPITTPAEPWTNGAIASLKDLAARPGDAAFFLQGIALALAAGSQAVPPLAPSDFFIAMNGASIGQEFLSNDVLAPSARAMPAGQALAGFAGPGVAIGGFFGGAALLVCLGVLVLYYRALPRRTAKVMPQESSPQQPPRPRFTTPSPSSPASALASASASALRKAKESAGSSDDSSAGALEHQGLHSEPMAAAATSSPALSQSNTEVKSLGAGGRTASGSSSAPAEDAEALPTEDDREVLAVQPQDASSQMPWDREEESSTLAELLGMPVTRELVVRSLALTAAGGAAAAAAAVAAHPGARQAPFASRLPRVGRLVGAGARTLQAFQRARDDSEAALSSPSPTARQAKGKAQGSTGAQRQAAIEAAISAKSKR